MDAHPEAPEHSGNFFDLISILSEALDMVSPLLGDHHERTTWFAVRIAEEMGLAKESLQTILYAGLLHDIGALSLKMRLDTLRFEMEDPRLHAWIGYRLLYDFGPLSEEAEIILAHHAWWRPDGRREAGAGEVPQGSHILHLADRAAILLEDEDSVAELGDDIIGSIQARKGTMFMPEAVEVLKTLALDDEFWFSPFRSDLKDQLKKRVDPRPLVLSIGDLEDLSRVFARIIDYRSRYTAAHSLGVAAVAGQLARILGFSERNCRIMGVAGCLHDLGKLAIPAELLEKNNHLDEREYIYMKEHALHTQRLLQKVPGLGYGMTWASQHHERLDGSGYPLRSGADDIAFGSRVIAAADIFTAVTEDRPYRASMSSGEALVELKHLTDNGFLDREVFQAVADHYDELDRIRREAQNAAMKDYRERIGIVTAREGRDAGLV